MLQSLTHPFVLESLLALFVIAQCVTAVKKESPRIPVGLFLLILLMALCALAHIAVDLRYLHVLQNNHSAQPLAYRIASLWSHHETSLFVWLFFLNGASHLAQRLLQSPSSPMRRILAFLNVCLGLYLIIEASPFAMAASQSTDGMGINPLLYDLNMVWHPPLLYLGQVILFIPYSLSFISGQSNIITHTLKISGGILTTAIALGALWAFTQLGWGGFWFWDPVETASLLPLVATLIALHMPKSWREHNPWISAIPFGCVILSLWAIRSGILQSVHSFAQDTMAFWVLGFLVIAVWIPIFWMVIRSYRFAKPNTRPDFYRLVGAFILMATFCVLIIGLFGAVVTQATITEFFFHQTLSPIWIIGALGIAGIFIFRYFNHLSITASLIGACLFLWLCPNLGLMPTLLGISGALCAGAMLPTIMKKPTIALSHMGAGFMLIGLALHSHSGTERIIMLNQNVPYDLGNNHTLTYTDIVHQTDSFLDTKTAIIKVGNPNGTAITLTPSRLYFHQSSLQRAKASFARLGSHIIMVTNFEEMNNIPPTPKILVTYHDKQGLLWIALGVICIAMGFWSRKPKPNPE